MGVAVPMYCNLCGREDEKLDYLEFEVDGWDTYVCTECAKMVSDGYLFSVK